MLQNVKHFYCIFIAFPCLLKYIKLYLYSRKKLSNFSCNLDWGKDSNNYGKILPSIPASFGRKLQFFLRKDIYIFAFCRI